MMKGRGIRITHSKEQKLAEYLMELFPGFSFEVFGRLRTGFDIQWEPVDYSIVEQVSSAAKEWIESELEDVEIEFGEVFEGQGRFEMESE